MELTKAIDHVNSFFVYQGESGLEKWRVLSGAVGDVAGDCEDYILSVIRATCKTSPGFLLAVSNPFKYRIWHVTDPRGNAHAVCVTNGGMAFDNHRKQLTAVSDYKARGYKFRFLWPFPMIWLKLLIGKF